MTETPTARTRPARASRDEGQWALGSTTPLNANEEFKIDDDGLNVRERIETVYSREGFASIPADDLRGRMRWWGLYTQRRPGIDGGRTASLPAEELDDEYFMLRIRSDGGALSSAQLHARSPASPPSSPAGPRTSPTARTSSCTGSGSRTSRRSGGAWRPSGLSSTEACGDTPRVILGSPVAGVAADEIIDGTPAIEAIVARYIGDPEYSNLPRKFKTAISGSPRQDVAHEINDVSFVGVVHPEHGPGFDVWVGGGLSTNPMLAQRLGAWVPLDEVPEVWGGIIEIFRDYGYRRLRNRARLKFLVADWGAAQFPRGAGDRVPRAAAARRAGTDPVPAGARDHVGVHPQRDGRFYVGAAPTVGRISGDDPRAARRPGEPSTGPGGSG